jgi:hypothetical protein
MLIIFCTKTSLLALLTNQDGSVVCDAYIIIEIFITWKPGQLYTRRVFSSSSTTQVEF